MSLLNMSSVLLPTTVNSLYNGHHRDHDLVSVKERVCDSRSNFQQFIFPSTSAPVRNNAVSVIARCRQGEVDCTIRLPFLTL